MTQDELIRMAEEAGFDIEEGLFPFEAAEDKYIGTERTLERFAALVAAHEREKPTTEALRQAYIAGMRAEREACAKVCEESRNNHRWDDYIEGCEDCAAAIRSRSNEH